MEPDSVSVRNALTDFFSVPFGGDISPVLRRHPELFTDKAESLLNNYWRHSTQGDVLRSDRVALGLYLLRRCRVSNIDTAVQELHEFHYKMRSLVAMARVAASTDVDELLDETIPFLEEMLSHPLLNGYLTGYRSLVLGFAASSYLSRYEQAEDRSDLERAIDLSRQLSRAGPSDSPISSAQPPVLPVTLIECYKSTGDTAALDEAIALLSQRLESIGAGHSVQAAWCTTSLGNARVLRFGFSGNRQDLDEGLRLLREAVGYAQSSPHSLLACKVNLGLGLSKSYAVEGNLDQLEEGIKLFRWVTERTSPNSTKLVSRLDSLANGLICRYRHLGQLHDLEESVQIHQQTVRMLQTARAKSSKLAQFSSNLGAALRDRYDRTDDIRDLRGAINNANKAVKLCAPDDRSRATYLNERGISYRRRYYRTGRSSDLQRAIQDFREAVDKTPSTSPDSAVWVSNLGTVLEDRYEARGSIDDLNSALDNYSNSIDIAKPGSHLLANCLNNVGNAALTRYLRLSDALDLTKSIEAFRLAVDTTPASSPLLPFILEHLGRALIVRYDESRNAQDLSEAIETGTRCWSLLRVRIAVAPVDYKIGGQRESVNLLGWLVYAYLQRANLYVGTAGSDVRRAIEIAEWVKSRILTDLIGRQAPPIPSAIPSQLADRANELLSQLTVLDRGEVANYGATPEASRLKDLQQRQVLLERLDRVWVAIEETGISGRVYSALRQGKTLEWGELAVFSQELGAETALLSMFTTAKNVHLFVVRSGTDTPTVVTLRLDATARRAFVKGLVRDVHRYRHIGKVKDSWSEPLVLLLRDAAKHLSGVRRIVFAPETFGHLVPWTVIAMSAGIVRADGLPIPTITVPSLGSLRLLRGYPRKRGVGPLVVGDPRGDLAHARAEAASIGKLLGTKALIGHRATKAAVLDRMADASLIHLATHGVFNQKSPLDSYVVFADHNITAREIMGLRTKADLVVLSACETGVSHPLGGDELAGLAQAFFYAGARSLIVSLWRVADGSTAELFRLFYRALKIKGDKSEALSEAIGALKAQKRWSHPYYWGAFQVMGNWD